jgi:hypothetical protein
MTLYNLKRRFNIEMTVEDRRDLVGNSYGLFEVLSQHSPGRSEG